MVKGTINKYVQKNKKNIFPSYTALSNFKRTCSPCKNFINVSETKASVGLQAVLNHTASRIINMKKDKIIQIFDSENVSFKNINLLCSWGIDGSTGHSNYQQKFDGVNESMVTDSELLVTAFSPIRLAQSENDGNIFWLNLLTQSTRFCRPLAIEYVKESKEKVLESINFIKNKISNLIPFKIDLSETKYVIITYSFYMSMIDGKVLAYVTNTSSMQCCCICGAALNEMNSKDNLENGFLAREESLHYGISPLHCWMRFFECLLHISYRLEFKQWKVTKNFKDIFTQRKKSIQQKMYEEFGLRVVFTISYKCIIATEMPATTVVIRAVCTRFACVADLISCNSCRKRCRAILKKQN